MTYIAKCPNGCASFKGDSGNVWVKIDQDGCALPASAAGLNESSHRFDADHNSTARSAYPWGENLLHLSPSIYKVTIPAGLANGEYILRHEVRVFL